MTQIKFGTDGWRAIIGKDYTPENVSKIIQAFCDVQINSSNKLVYLGYDRRSNSEFISKLVAQVLATNGFTVRLAKQFCPTPCVSWLVKQNKALAGVMVTASHNPPEWNGIKFKESYGGAASPEYTNEIENKIIENDKKTRVLTPKDFDTLLKEGGIEYFDPDQTYVQHLKKFVAVDKINKAQFRIIVDVLFGAGTDYIKKVLGADVIQIHGEADPNFGGLNPEPIEKNLQALKSKILAVGAHVGLATDGDADRIGAYDETGHYVSSHQIFSLLLKHNIEYRKLAGPVIKSVSTTSLIDKICAKNKLPLTVTPVGFKHISKHLLQQNALMGGEESGGISLREHVHERDGVLNGLLLLEMMAVRQKTLGQLVSELNSEYGLFVFKRDDYHPKREKIDEVVAKLKQNTFDKVGLSALESVDRQDGAKFFFVDGSWLLFRASGTEPLLRVYAEAATEARVNELLSFAKEHFGL